MIVSFFGHSVFSESLSLKHRLLDVLEETILDSPVTFLLGMKGLFDSFAFSCCLHFKNAHPHVKIACVLAYLNEQITDERFDEYIYPPLETVPPRIAILKRNAWMVKESDFLITYVDHSFGGAYQAFSHAVKLKKKIINLGKLSPNAL